VDREGNAAHISPVTIPASSKETTSLGKQPLVELSQTDDEVLTPSRTPFVHKQLEGRAHDAYEKEWTRQVAVFIGRQIFYI